MSAADARTDLAGALVLVVEDEDGIRELYSMVLPHVSPGLTIDTARSGAEGLERARTTLPDLILMDLNMPGMSGIEATRRLKEDPKTAHIPVIAVTGLPELTPHAMAAGCASFVLKPSTAAEILQEVSRTLHA